MFYTLLKKIYLLSFVYFLLIQNNTCQIQFEHFTIENGLSNNSIRTIIQDDMGFLWFGTLNGLNRFDGKKIRTFTYEPGNLNSLISNRVSRIYEDSLNYLWLFTFENKILRFDPRDEKFVNINQLTNEHLRPLTEPTPFIETSPGRFLLSPNKIGLIKINENIKKGRIDIQFYDTLNVFLNNKINFIFSDLNKKVWLGTENGLFAIKDDDTEISSSNIKTYYKSSSNTINFTNAFEIDGQVIFTTANKGIYCIKNDTINNWKKELNITSSVNVIKESKNHDILITTNNQGFYFIKKNSNNFVQFSRSESNNYKAFNSYYNIFEDSYGIFWLITSERGISMFNPENMQLKHFGLNPEYRETPGDDDKQVIIEDSNRDLWIGLYGGGLFKLNRNQLVFNQYTYSKDNPNGLSSNIILSIFEDASNNLWIGTFQGGLNKLELINYNFEYFEPVKNARFKTQNEVRSLIEDQYNRLWVGTRDGHVYCYNVNNEIIFKIPEDLHSYNHQYVKANVYALLGEKGNLWIGTKGEGLMCIRGILFSNNLKNESFKTEKYIHNDNDSNSLSHDDVFALHQDHLGQIWIGTYYNGIDIIKNPDDVINFLHIRNIPNDKNSLSNNLIRCFYQDNDKNMWIGTSYGLNFLESKYLDKKNKIFTNFFCDPYNKNTLSNNDIFNIHQDSRNQIWLATYGGGLNLLVTDSITGMQYFKHYFRKDGLPSDVVFSILNDDDGNLWLGTDNGLCKFSDYGKQIERYVSKEGTGDNFFSEGTCIMAENDDFIFGQKSGFLRFNPKNIKKDLKQYPLVLTGFYLFDQPVSPKDKGSPLKHSIETTNEIVLNYNQNFISIEFALLDYKSPEKINYSFILENFEKNWNNVLNQNKAVYRGLIPGKYIFRVKSTNSNGIWLENENVLKIIINPPYWKTYWAYIIYIIVLFFLVWLTTYFISKEIKIRNEIKIEKRITEDKLMFFTNISHEFKTPLTLINSSTDDLLESSGVADNIRNKIELIKKNSSRLFNLIEQLLDFRRIQKGKMELKTSKIEIVSFLNDLQLSFKQLSEKKNILFIFKSNVEKYEGWIDPKHIEKIIINLLSNAFKHTPENKSINMYIRINKSDKFLSVQVKDEGEGIKSENLQKIFNRFAFIDDDIYNQFKGSGIGLSLSRDLAKLHKGNIIVESQPEKGSIFTLTVPVGENYYSDEEKDLSENPKIIQKMINQQFIIDDNIDPYDESFGKSSAVKSQILIIDDNAEFLKYMYDKLKKHFIIHTAKNGEDGISMATEHNPDLILSDVKMPKIDGMELVKKLKTNFNTSHIPIILLTAKSSIENKIEGFDLGADDYITKPFNMKYLYKRILNIINQRKILKEKFSQDPGFKPEKLTVSPNDQRFLNDIVSLVEENIKSPGFSIETIIEEMGYSRTVFYKKMKGISGYAPKEYIRIIRMKKAAELLRKPDSCITDVSYEVGYSDPDYFSKSFKNYFGEPPSEYQKKYK